MKTDCGKNFGNSYKSKKFKWTEYYPKANLNCQKFNLGSVFGNIIIIYFYSSKIWLNQYNLNDFSGNSGIDNSVITLEIIWWGVNL